MGQGKLSSTTGLSQKCEASNRQAKRTGNPCDVSMSANRSIVPTSPFPPGQLAHRNIFRFD